MFEPRINEDNTEPRCACVLLLDTSGSMRDEPIAELKDGLQRFATDIKKDALARKRVEVSVITFADYAQTVSPFTEAQNFVPPPLQASGLTSMGAGIELALDELEQQKLAYKESGIEYYQPWLVIMTDGSPSDDTLSAVNRLVALEKRKGIVVMPIAVGNKADMEFLSRLSSVRTPAVMGNVQKFAEFFVWLSKSLGAMAVSSNHGADDDAAQHHTQIPLASPSGWMTA